MSSRLGILDFKYTHFYIRVFPKNAKNLVIRNEIIPLFFAESFKTEIKVQFVPLKDTDCVVRPMCITGSAIY